MDAEITNARPEDLNAVLALLTDASLPGDGVAEHLQNFLMAGADGEVVGSVGIEGSAPSTLLRLIPTSSQPVGGSGTK